MINPVAMIVLAGSFIVIILHVWLLLFLVFRLVHRNGLLGAVLTRKVRIGLLTLFSDNQGVFEKTPGNLEEITRLRRVAQLVLVLAVIQMLVVILVLAGTGSV